jgi:DNA transformation protein
MGKKGARLTGTATDVAEAVALALTPLGDVTTRKMFGGYGVFGTGVMFAIVDSSGQVFLRVSGATRPRFEAAGSEPHGRMPYYTVPRAVLDADADLVEWAAAALAAATAAKT